MDFAVFLTNFRRFRAQFEQIFEKSPGMTPRLFAPSRHRT